jgi:hypothetical protein
MNAGVKVRFWWQWFPVRAVALGLGGRCDGNDDSSL